MIYLILAEIVVLLHFLFIIFSVLGGILTIWKKWMPYFHIPAALWGSFIIIMGWTCPLTPLENFLRSAGNAESYAGGFIAHYVIPVIYPEGLSRELQVSLGLIALAINVVIYFCVWYWGRGKKFSQY
ncbi:DUF2784 domain-containing protein [Kaarinaea lacus]